MRLFDLGYRVRVPGSFPVQIALGGNLVPLLATLNRTAKVATNASDSLSCFQHVAKQPRPRQQIFFSHFTKIDMASRCPYSGLCGWLSGHIPEQQNEPVCFQVTRQHFVKCHHPETSPPDPLSARIPDTLANLARRLSLRYVFLSSCWSRILIMGSTWTRILAKTSANSVFFWKIEFQWFSILHHGSTSPGVGCRGGERWQIMYQSEISQGCSLTFWEEIVNFYMYTCHFRTTWFLDVNF